MDSNNCIPSDRRILEQALKTDHEIRNVLTSFLLAVAYHLDNSDEAIEFRMEAKKATEKRIREIIALEQGR